MTEAVLDVNPRIDRKTAMKINHAFLSHDGTEIRYKDLGTGKPIVFSHGWPLHGGSWLQQMLTMASKGFRCIAHDRRGHGCSLETAMNNDMDTFADDLAVLIDTLDLHEATLVGFSTGGGEVTRYIGRHGTKRVAKVVLVSAVPPLMLKTDRNPGGLPLKTFDDLRSQYVTNREKLFRDLANGPFFGFNRAKAKVSLGLVNWFWMQAMQSDYQSALDCIKAFSETDFTEDLKRLNVPTLMIQGDDDQIVPISAAAIPAATIAPQATLKIYEGAPHGLTETHQDQLNADLLDFLRH